MTFPSDNSKLPVDWLNGWKETQGKPRPDDEQAVDNAIRKVMVAQRRATKRNHLPDLAP